MRLLFAACFGVALLILVAIHSAESGTCDKTNVCPAIEALGKKLEKLIALVTPPGKIELTNFINLNLDYFLSLFSFFFAFFLVSSGSPELNILHSCSHFFLQGTAWQTQVSSHLEFLFNFFLNAAVTV